MAYPISVSEDPIIKNEIEDALPGDDEKPFHFPNPLLSPKLEDVRLHNLASILRPCKFEYGTQESKCSNNEASFERWPMADVVSWGVDLSLYPISNKFCTDQFTPSSSYADTVQEIPAVEEPASDVSFANDKKSWPRQHIETLVALYQEQEEASKPVNSVFWSRVSASFLEDGIHYSSAQCQTKMKNLKRQYRDQKDKAGRSGAGKVVWEHFELMKGLMAPKPEGTDAITASNRGSLRTPGNFASQSSPVPEASVGSKDAEPKRANKRRCFSNAEGFQQLSNDANLRHEERLRFEQKVHQERMKVHQDKMKVKLELLEVKKEALKTVKKMNSY